MLLWKKIRHRIEVATLRFFAWLIPRLSRRTCLHLANALGEIASRLDGKGRAIALANIRCALGDVLSDSQQLDAMRASYRNFARTMVDMLWAPALAKPENHHWLRIQKWPGYERLLEAEKRGAVMLSIHFGNWEWGSLSCALAGYPALAVAEKFKNPGITPIITQAREATGQRIIAQEQSILKMLRAVKRGGYAAYLADLTLRPSEASTVIHTFGMEICVSILHAVLVQRGGALIVPFSCHPDPDGGCTSVMHPPLEVSADASARQIAQQCWNFYEVLVRNSPGLWLWPYKHFRYKPRGSTREYPFYANESGAFEKLRAEKIAP